MKKKNLIFREITLCTKNQIENIRYLRNLDNIKKYMYTDYKISRKEHSEYIAKLKNDNKNLVFIIFSDINEIIGLASLNSINKLQKKTNWAFYTNPEVRNIGAVIEYYFIEFIFNKLNFENLDCEVIENNISTQKLHKKFFFEKKGVKKKNIIRNQKKLDVYLYNLTKSNWNEKKYKLSKFLNFFEKYNAKFEFNNIL